jgi:hypothetical protein
MRPPRSARKSRAQRWPLRNRRLGYTLGVSAKSEKQDARLQIEGPLRRRTTQRRKRLGEKGNWGRWCSIGATAAGYCVSGWKRCGWKEAHEIWR